MITVLFIIKINLLVSVILFFTKEIYRKKKKAGDDINLPPRFVLCPENIVS